MGQSSRPNRLSQVLLLTAPYGVAALLVVALRVTGIGESLNLLLYDLITYLRPAPSGATTPIVIIGISEADITRHGWPIDDRLLCRAIDTLSADGARAIGLDLYRNRGVGLKQRCLRSQARANPRLVSIFNVAESIGPILGTPANRMAFNDLVVDADGVVRRDLVHVSGQDAATVALPLRLVEVFRGNGELRRRLEARPNAEGWIERDSGGYFDLDAAGFQQMLAFHQPGSFPVWSLDQLLSQQVPKAQINSRIVLIGSTAPTLRDLFNVPYTRFVLAARQIQMPGVELHANRTAALLALADGQPHGIRALPGWSGTLLLLLALGLGVALGESFATLRRSILAVTAVVMLGLGGAVALLFNGVWVQTTLPMAALTLMAGAAWLRRGAASQQQRQQIQRLLGQTTSPAVAQQLWEQRDELLSDGRFEGRLLAVTVLFSDTCDFTSLSERIKPAQLLAWLNRGMAICVPAITERGGMVNKFTGDGFLAVFGAPLGKGEVADAADAIDAALAIQHGLEQLNGELAADGEPAMRMRIGIHSGAVLAGSMGSSERLEYAVIGDTVNCASRLESSERERQSGLCRVLVSSVTRDLVLLSAPKAVEWEAWGSLQVKGRTEPLDVWELRGSAPVAMPASPHQ
ncbi:adenylate/guanylate cyclase domain-containing protein [Synechococcus sp. CS-1324]|uniref:CHASE2 domain-containing protein n=1 Tax=unclassified Synechococcus TaxID=2626047 RepID=UPI000DB0893E|nr:MULTISPECIES: adenylate/guanylate cyclase domain-containing protein [unclassified Synechococcus]MCT0212629.1 adenylate/guanylate cyclase domain-containing protein [Synechococcus sp. CS-1326]MCT0230336.1 adenylate/guanylate cyclase domain-containing protein [Synechococcus sp. CS-1324]MCT0233638.1 adenylate/guanylate cyclase domain-containing protein [Synechococcus sp. CS-1327]PZV00426.1 MAG: adenylate/guanylate cyclase domain-containing protein [Cyanobium sp.]